MNVKKDHYGLYEAIADLIDYCSINELPQTRELLTVTISILCQEEGKINSLEKSNIIIFPRSKRTPL